MNDLYLIVNSVEGLTAGAYLFRREEESLELLKEGDFRDRAAYLGLEQELPGDASVAVFFLADLRPILGIADTGSRNWRRESSEANSIWRRTHSILGRPGSRFLMTR